MATTSSCTVLFPLVCFLLYNHFASSASIPYPSSCVAFDQHKFWSTNVRNNMPKVVLSKLSPMSKRESDYFSSLLSTKSFDATTAFCSIAGLACSVDTHETHGSKPSTESELKENVRVADSSEFCKQNRYAPYVEKESLPSKMPEQSGYGPLVAKESHPSSSSSYNSYVETASTEPLPSKMPQQSGYGPLVAKEYRPSSSSSYNSYVQTASTEPLPSKMPEQSGYGPLVAKESRPSSSSSYNSYVQTASSEPKINGYEPHVSKTPTESNLNTHKPNVGGLSKGSDQNGYKPFVANESHHSMSVDPSIFFRLSILERGNKVLLPSSLNYKLPHRSLLPKQISKKIPLSPRELKRIFPTSFVSPVTRNAILTTLSFCNAPAVMGDIKSCHNSLEGMIQFSQSILGKQVLSAMTTESENGSGHKLLIEKITSFPGKKYVACHELFLPFATHFCHFLESTRLYRVGFVHPETKIPVNNVLAMCHMKTKNFPADHVSLRALNLAPGQGEVCHWLLPTEIVWVDAGY